MVGNLFDVDLERFTQETILPVGDHRNKNNDFHNKRVSYRTAFSLNYNTGSMMLLNVRRAFLFPVCISLAGKSLSTSELAIVALFRYIQ